MMRIPEFGSVPWPVKMPPKSSISQMAPPKRTAAITPSRLSRTKNGLMATTMQRTATAMDTSRPWWARAPAMVWSRLRSHPGSPSLMPEAIALKAFGARSPGWRMK
jgi:hypothetical protein